MFCRVGIATIPAVLLMPCDFEEISVGESSPSEPFPKEAHPRYFPSSFPHFLLSGLFCCLGNRGCYGKRLPVCLVGNRQAGTLRSPRQGREERNPMEEEGAPSVGWTCLWLWDKSRNSQRLWHTVRRLCIKSKESLKCPWPGTGLPTNQRGANSCKLR